MKDALLANPWSIFKVLDKPYSSWEAFEDKPAVDISEDEKAFFIDADLPGFNKEDINISLDRDTMTIKAEKVEESEEEGKEYHRRERRSKSFVRKFALQEGLDTDSIGANYKSGVLSLRIPKTKKKAKRILIEG